jgi:ERCC4-type nuclease
MKPCETVFKIVQDSREQKPLVAFNRETVRKKLDTGDYSVDGYEDKITFEHKSIKDLIGTCNRTNRDRFKRELQRMADGYQFYCIIVSGNRRDILPQCDKTYKTQLKAYYAKKKRGIQCRPPMRPDVRAKSVIGTLMAWRVDYNVHHYFLGDKVTAAQWIENQMEYFMRHKQQGEMKCKMAEQIQSKKTIV